MTLGSDSWFPGSPFYGFIVTHHRWYNHFALLPTFLTKERMSVQLRRAEAGDIPAIQALVTDQGRLSIENRFFPSCISNYASQKQTYLTSKLQNKSETHTTKETSTTINNNNEN